MRGEAVPGPVPLGSSVYELTAHMTGSLGGEAGCNPVAGSAQGPLELQ